MNLKAKKSKVLILGIGDILMVDEGLGIKVVCALEKAVRPETVECLGGGKGRLRLLEPMQNAKKVILIDAGENGAKRGTVRRLCPRLRPRVAAYPDGARQRSERFARYFYRATRPMGRFLRLQFRRFRQ
ncbi:MAG: hydrogenase maturation protease [Actinomycetota bacterium]